MKNPLQSIIRWIAVNVAAIATGCVSVSLSNPPAAKITSSIDARTEFAPEARVLEPTLRSRHNTGPRPRWMRSYRDTNGGGGYTYVTEEFWREFSQYPLTNPHDAPPVCRLGPAVAQRGMASDAAGYIYVAASTTQGDWVGVVTFKKDCGSAGPSFLERDGVPEDPVVDGETLYLTNIWDGYQKPVHIDVFNLKHGPYISRRLSSPLAAGGLGVAVDSHHNLFWSTTTPNVGGGQIIEFVGGKEHGQVLSATLIGTDFPGGVIVDHSDNLLFIDQTTRQVKIFAPPYTRGPRSTIQLMGTAVYCSLGPTERRLFCLDYEYGSVDLYSYPQGAYLSSYSNGIEVNQDPIGIVTVPAS